MSMKQSATSDPTMTPETPSGLLGLPIECFRQIINTSVKYDDQSLTNLRDAVRLIQVCKLFETEVMRAISSTKLLRKMRKNHEVTLLRQRAYSKVSSVSNNCRISSEENAISFLARYIMIQPWRHIPWNSSFSSVVNSVVNIIMREDGVNPDGAESITYVCGLCHHAVRYQQPGPSSLIDECGIWTIFQPHIQSLLFASKTIITKESLESLVLTARIYLKKPDVEGAILSMILKLGPKSLSTFRPTIHDDPLAKGNSKSFTRKPLFGSLLEAAIRSGNQNLSALLMKYEVDMSRDKSTQTPQGKRKKGKKYYDPFFCQLALKYQDLETFLVLMESGGRRQMTRSEYFPVIMEAVCNNQPEAAKLLLNGPLPVDDIRPPLRIWEHPRPQIDVFDIAVEEALFHGHAEIFGLIVDLIHPNMRGDYFRQWDKFWGLPNSNNDSTPDAAKFSIEIAAERGDENELRSLLSQGASPYGPDVRSVGSLCSASNPGEAVTHLKPMIAAARNWHVGAALILIEGGFKGTELDWLLIIGSVIATRRDDVARDLPVALKNAEGSQEIREIADQRDVAFWQELVDSGGVNLQHAHHDCSCCRSLPTFLISWHQTRIGLAKSFVRESLRIVEDPDFRSCDGTAEDSASIRTAEATSLLFVL